MIDFLRLYGGHIFGLIITLLVLSIIFHILNSVIRNAADSDDEVITQIHRHWITIKLFTYGAVLVGFALWLTTATLTNETPRGIIDRSQVKQQAHDFAKQHSSEGGIKE